jgi:hypothetical protein
MRRKFTPQGRATPHLFVDQNRTHPAGGQIKITFCRKTPGMEIDFLHHRRAGENFIPWIKSRKLKRVRCCPKKFTDN